MRGRTAGAEGRSLPPALPAGPALSLAGLALLMLALVLPAGAFEPERLVAGFPRGQAILLTSGPACIQVSVAIAATPEHRARGLMYMESMGEFEGMYFQYPEPATIVMWMKNTALPLDMLFIGTDGRVAGVVADATPYSTTRIPSPVPVDAVLELNAGSARRWGVTAGTRVLLSPLPSL